MKRFLNILFLFVFLVPYINSQDGIDIWSTSTTTIGRVYAMAIDENNPSTVYACGLDQGVWITTNSGANWTQMNNGLTNTQAQAIALCKNSSQVLYVGTAPGANDGVYKSTDGGGSWTRVVNGIAEPVGTLGVQALLVHPSNANIAYCTIFNATANATIGIYKTTDGGANWFPIVNWNSETPPDALVELVDSNKVLPCRTIDLGCGAGNYAIYLAGKGFEVTGVHSSPTAVAIAREHAQKKGVRCRFIVADLLGDMHEVPGTFDFAFDWEVLHHIFPGDPRKYAGNVAGLLNKGGLYLSVCFSESDPQFGGTGKYRSTRVGPTLYFSSESELRDLYSTHFSIRDLKTIEVSGKYGPHRAVYVLSERR